MPRLLTLPLLLAVVACDSLLGPTTRDVPLPGPGERAVLFVGNSHTMRGDVPQMVRALALSVGDTITTYGVAENNWALEDHYASGEVQRRLRAARWYRVVMQQGTSALPASQEHLAQWTRAFEPFIREAGAEPVLYQIWPHVTRRFDADAALTSYWNAAAAVNGTLAPVGDAFTAALADSPSIDPYDADGLHANLHGVYLAAVVITARLTGASPLDMPPAIPGYVSDSTMVRRLQRVAAVALARSPARPGAPRELGAVPSTTRAGSTPRVVHPDTTFFPEGIDADPRDGALYVTSVAHRNVLRVSRDGRTSWLLATHDAGRDASHNMLLGAAMGVAIDEARDLAWITTAAPPASHRRAADTALVSELLAVGLADGRVRQRIALGDSTAGTGDLAVTAQGDVLVSDGRRGLLHRLRAGAHAVETVRHQLLRSPQGIAPAPDGASAWVADWSRGLLHWDLESGALTPLRLPSQESGGLKGVDGLRWHAGHLLGVQNGPRPMRVVRLVLTDDGRAVQAVETLDQPTEPEGELTVGTVLEGQFVYVASSAWPFWGPDGRRLPAAGPLPPVVVRALPLR